MMKSWRLAPCFRQNTLRVALAVGKTLRMLQHAPTNPHTASCFSACCTVSLLQMCPSSKWYCFELGCMWAADAAAPSRFAIKAEQVMQTMQVTYTRRHSVKPCVGAEHQDSWWIPSGEACSTPLCQCSLHLALSTECARNNKSSRNAAAGKQSGVIHGRRAEEATGAQNGPATTTQDGLR